MLNKEKRMKKSLELISMISFDCDGYRDSKNLMSLLKEIENISNDALNENPNETIDDTFS